MLPLPFLLPCPSFLPNLLSFFVFPFFPLPLFHTLDHSCPSLQAMWQSMCLHQLHHSKKWSLSDRKWSAWTIARLTYPPRLPQSTHTKQVRHTHTHQMLPQPYALILNFLKKYLKLDFEDLETSIKKKEFACLWLLWTIFYGLPYHYLKTNEVFYFVLCVLSKFLWISPSTRIF